MTTLRNVAWDMARFRRRILVLGAVVLVCFVLLFMRLLYLQVWRHADLRAQAENNRTSIVPIVPNRGLILDRNGIVLATNYAAYTLEITPGKSAPLEPLMDALAQVVDISLRDRRRFKKLLEESRSFESLPIRTRLSDVEVARFAAQRYRFPGVEIRARLFRSYPYGQLASHVIGYIGRINQSEKQQIEESDDADNYLGTEYIGKIGIEQSYEAQLHGTSGMEQIETSAGGRATRTLASHAATPGNTVQLTIDIQLQHLVESLYGARRGALVALDPRNGEILAFVSTPTFDPNLFVEGIDSDSWQALNASIDKPLLNRALRGTYPPGSTYKPFMALAALETGARSPEYSVSDPGYFDLGNHRFRDDKEGGHGMVNMYRSIVDSCDTYYYTLANEMGVDSIHDQLQRFGFGQATGVDILGETRGLLPSTDWKRRAFKRPDQQKWYAGETISIGIGQGYNAFSMLQLGQAVASLANNGLRIAPHLVTATVDAVSHISTPVARPAPIALGLQASNLDTIRKAMVGVTLEGTAARAFAGAGYVSGGKTGTAQAISIGKDQKYDASKLAEHLRDHALYIAYAPADAPTIALALIVENAGFGAEHAAPIARRVLDYWLLGQYPSEADLAAVSKGQAAAPIGKSRLAAEVFLGVRSEE
ncbi:MAG: penicillin-binding protein 2 [Rhodoferax sp.]|nr:penicillin-binding protein 2 [Rhodoferax sp.]